MLSSFGNFRPYVGHKKKFPNSHFWAISAPELLMPPISNQHISDTSAKLAYMRRMLPCISYTTYTTRVSRGLRRCRMIGECRFILHSSLFSTILGRQCLGIAVYSWLAILPGCGASASVQAEAVADSVTKLGIPPPYLKSVFFCAVRDGMAQRSNKPPSSFLTASRISPTRQ